MKTFIYQESIKYPELNSRFYNLLKALGNIEDISAIYMATGKGKQIKENNFKHVYENSKASTPDDAILINGDPEMHEKVMEIKHDKYIFDLSALPIFKYSSWDKNIKDVIIAADYVTTTTEICKDYVENTHGKKCTVVKNGIDLRLFMDTIPLYSVYNDKHTIGILGDPANIDWNLLDNVIKQCAAYNFIFFMDKKKTYPSHGNMFFAKEKTSEEYLPILKSLDAMIIPYKNDVFTRSMEYPFLYECIALQKPIIATQAIENNSGLKKRAIDTQDNMIDFANAIKIGIERTSSLVQKPSIEMVEEDTWENRAKQIKELLEN